jgi:large subunit ribosomal protein L28
MPRHCSLTGKRTSHGHNVSHSNRKTPRTFAPNLKNASLVSEALGTTVSLRISTAALRTVTRRGGLDAFLASTPDAKLPPEALRLKRRIRKARG